MSEEESTTVAVVSPEQGDLIAAGAHPVDVDVHAMMEQIKAMQARIDSLSAAQGLPSDPVGAAVQNLVAHAKARQAAWPNYDLSGLIKELEEVGESPSSKDTDRIRNVVQDTIEDNGLISHDLTYLTRLARDLQTEVLKREGK